MTSDQWVRRNDNLDSLVAGFTTSQKTRPLMVEKFREYVRERSCVIRSKRLSREQKQEKAVVDLINQMFIIAGHNVTYNDILGKEKMRKPGTKGAPTAKAFTESAKTAKPVKRKTK